MYLSYEEWKRREVLSVRNTEPNPAEYKGLGRYVIEVRFRATRTGVLPERSYFVCTPCARLMYDPKQEWNLEGGEAYKFRTAADAAAVARRIDEHENVKYTALWLV